MTDSRHKDHSNPFIDFSSELVFVNEEELDLPKEYDLYEMLVKEPSFIKKDSIKYDYLPKCPTLYFNEN